MWTPNRWPSGGYLPDQQVHALTSLAPDVLSPEEARFILGAQANVWTEYIATPDYLEYMLYPRMCAISEVQWTAKEKRDWSDFEGRLSDHLARLDALQVHYAKSIYDVEGVYKDAHTPLQRPLAHHPLHDRRHGAFRAIDGLFCSDRLAGALW